MHGATPTPCVNKTCHQMSISIESNSRKLLLGQHHTIESRWQSRLTAFGISLSHALTSTTSALNSTQDAIKVSSTAPFLMSQDVATELTLASLHNVDVRKHTIGLEAFGELVADCGGAVQAGERDELEDETGVFVSYVWLLINR